LTLAGGGRIFAPTYKSAPAPLARPGAWQRSGNSHASQPYAPDRRALMTFFVECDWCGETLHDKDHAVLLVTVKRQRSGVLEGKWAEEVRPTRHLCVGQELDFNRLGLPDGIQDDTGSCYQRAIAAMCGLETDQPNLGMEWRLVPVDEPWPSKKVMRASVSEARRLAQRDRLDQVSPDLARIILARLPVARKYALPNAGITTVAQVAEMTDDELLALPGIGWGILRQLREALAELETSGGA
jgi:hypothetical protein